MELARAMQFTPVDQGSLKMAKSIEDRSRELFPSWRLAMKMFVVLYLILLLFIIAGKFLKKRDFHSFPLQNLSVLNAFCTVGILDMVYLPGCIAALLQLAHGTKYRRFPRWLDLWMKSRKQLGLIALVLAAMHGCMSTLYWSPEYKSRLYQKSSTKIGNFTLVEYKKMYAQGEAFLGLGVLALTSLCILGVTSLPTVLNRMSWREWNFVQSGVGYFALVCALLHFTVFAYDGIPKWKAEVYFYPTVLVVIVGYITVLLRLVLFLPCLHNRVKKIRRGWERGHVVV